MRRATTSQKLCSLNAIWTWGSGGIPITNGNVCTCAHLTRWILWSVIQLYKYVFHLDSWKQKEQKLGGPGASGIHMLVYMCYDLCVATQHSLSWNQVQSCFKEWRTEIQPSFVIQFLTSFFQICCFQKEEGCRMASSTILVWHRCRLL